MGICPAIKNPTPPNMDVDICINGDIYIYIYWGYNIGIGDRFTSALFIAASI